MKFKKKQFLFEELTEVPEAQAHRKFTRSLQTFKSRFPDAKVVYYGIEGARTITVLRYTNTNSSPEKPAAIIWIGNSMKPAFHYYFGTLDRRESFVQRTLEDTEKRWEAEDERKGKTKSQAATFMRSLIPGKTILYSSWGYDQTNIDFYRVKSVKGISVVLEELQQKIVTDGYQYSDMVEYVIPNETAPPKDIITVRMGSSGYLKIKNRYHLSIWENEPMYQSHYH